MLSDDEAIAVVGTAENGQEALQLIPRLNPDVVTLDINMPVMDGLTTLKHIMVKHPKPTVVLSTLAKEGASTTFDALKYGALDFMQKPSELAGIGLEKQRTDLIQKIKMAAEVQIGSVQYLRSPQADKNSQEQKRSTCKDIIALGASEGGYGALLKIIPYLKRDLAAAILVVMHAASQHVDAFAAYLDVHSALKVQRAHDGLVLRSAECYLLSGNEYVTIDTRNNQCRLQVSPAPFPGRRGSVNMMMFSLAEFAVHRAVGILLSGAGEDGVEGLGEILRRGGTGIVQSPQSCLCKETVSLALEKWQIANILADGAMASEINALFNTTDS